MQDRINQVEETSCTARPDHTVGSKPDMLAKSKCGPLFTRLRARRSDAHIAVQCQGTKSLRSSPLRGGKKRETGSQLRGQRWRV